MAAADTHRPCVSDLDVGTDRVGGSVLVEADCSASQIFAFSVCLPSSPATCPFVCSRSVCFACVCACMCESGGWQFWQSRETRLLNETIVPFCRPLHSKTFIAHYLLINYIIAALQENRWLQLGFIHMHFLARRSSSDALNRLPHTNTHTHSTHTDTHML